MPWAQGSASKSLTPEARRWVEETLLGLTLEQKVGQILVAGTETEFSNVESAQFQKLKEDISRYGVGAVHAFRGNVLTAAFLLSRLQELSAIPLLITADLEGGAGLIFDGATRFPKAMALAATQDPQYAYEAARITATEARSLGVHVNFYPVVDVNNNPRNPIINIRSFGGDPSRVSLFALPYIRGLQEHGVLATAKHFPGHGDTETDSHLALPVIRVSRERLERIELPPFRDAVKAGVDAVMTAHLYIPELEPQEGLPASLSSRITQELLRRELGFEGLIFTDAMTMRGVTAHFSDSDAAVRAFEAGADFILLPPSIKTAHEAMVGAVQAGRITGERLDASVRRILEAKARLGLHERKKTDLLSLDKIIAPPASLGFAQDIMDRAITLVRDERRVLPLRPRPEETVLLLSVLDERRPRETRGTAWLSEFQKRHPLLVPVEVFPETSGEQVRLILELAKRVDYIVAGMYVRIGSYKGSIELSSTQMQLLRGLAGLKQPAAFIVFGSPYLLLDLPELPTYVLAFDDFAGAELSAVRAILGEISFRGRLPVELPQLYPVGHGIVR